MILIFGCSYTHGEVPNQRIVEHTYPALIERSLNIPVINFGVPGGSNAFSDFLISKALDIFDPKFVFFQTTYPTRNFYGNFSGSLAGLTDFDEYLEQPIRGRPNYLRVKYRELQKQFLHFRPTSAESDGVRWYYEKFLNDRLDLEGTQGAFSALHRLRNIPHYAFEMYTSGLYGLEDKDILFEPLDWADTSKHLSRSGAIKLSKDLLNFM